VDLNQRHVVYAFGPFRLDTVRRLLIAGSRIRALPEKPFRILMALAESGGGIVERAPLTGMLWPDEDIGENSLTQHIYLLRSLLEELGGKRAYIRTEARRGYRLTLPVTAIDSSSDHFTPHIAAGLGNVVADGGFDTFRLYCEGCYHLEKRTHESLVTAASRFQQIVEYDPLHWQAHLGLARSHAFLGAYLYARSEAVFPKAKDAALRALEIQPSAPAYAQLAEILMFGEWDWRGAEAALQTALALQPESAAVHNHAAWLALGLGDLDRALYEARAALEIEPASLFYRNVLARVLIHRGSYENAAELLNQVLQLDRSMDAAIENLALAYTVSDRPERAVAILEQRRSHGSLEDHMSGQLAHAYGASGSLQGAEREYAQLNAARQTRYVPGWPMALAAVGLSRPAEAIQHLSRAAREREPVLVFLKTLPLFDALKDFEEVNQIRCLVGPQ
jgi:DNA-binding winged helix-turn-helix (wHTH) protein/tetratricopeptide (TPR) repeat protein